MKFGAEPRKVAALAVLLGVAAVLFYQNILSSEPETSPAPAPARPAAGPAPRPVASPPGASTPRSPNISRKGGAVAASEFRPSLKPRREERLDPMTFDPALRLDLLARLNAVKFDGGERSLFEFAPPPKVPEPKILPGPLAKALEMQKKPEEAATEEAKPAKPPPPPIPFKFFGYVSSALSGDRRAFFLEGEDIHVAGEGEVIKKRYKVVRIGLNSAVVEDTQHAHQQTLPLEPMPAAG